MKPMPTHAEALALLMAGNHRYVTGEMTYPRQAAVDRQALIAGQSPFAVILGCADSRVPPNLIFDQGLGDLFVIRVAGNIVDDAILGSIEFALATLQTPLVMVLGHANCGAVQATLSGGELAGHLPSLAAAIQPAVDRVKDAPGDQLDQAIKANALNVADQLRHSQPILAGSVRAGQVRIVAAHYDLASGKVTVLD